MLLVLDGPAPIPGNIFVLILAALIYLSLRLGRGDRRKSIVWFIGLGGGFFVLNLLFGSVGSLGEDTQKWMAIGVGVAVAVAALLLAGGIVRMVVVGMRRGSLRGTVVDQAGNPVPEAIVTVTHSEMESQHSSNSNARGEFSFERLTAGNYNVTVAAAGFAPAVRSDVCVEPRRTNSLRVSLSS